MVKSLIEVDSYLDIMPDGWSLSGDLEWPDDMEGASYNLTARNDTTGRSIRLQFANGTHLGSAVLKMAAACVGADVACERLANVPWEGQE